MDFQADTEIYPAGTIIGGGYKILSHLASGGMAHVYIALQSKLSRKVAFKVLSSTFATNVSVSKRFINEALIVAKLHHPHIVEVYDVGETEDHRPFMAMELLEGKGLGARIKEGPMTPAEAFPIVREVAESLAEAHAKGIIHRDLKPDNIFLTLKSGVKTLDFGIAKVLHGENDGTEEKLTRAGTAPGTPEYMSPEQARGQNLDARSDLYSLGIVLYEMLNGKPPFEEPTFLATILMQVQAPPPPLPDTVPAPLANYIINRLLAKDPNCRPSNAEEFIRELDELGQQLKIVVDSDGKTLMNALNEIELLRLQLAQTQQELQRSRDMACIDEADLEGSQTQPQVSVVPVGAPSLGDVSSLVVNPNLGLPAGRSANRASMVPSLVKQGNTTAVTSPSGNTTGGAAKSAVQEPSQESFRQIPGNAPITSATGTENQKSGGPMPPHVMPAGRKMPPSSNVGGAKMSPSSNVGGPNTANVAQAGAQPMRSGVMPAMPPNGMGQPMMGGASGAVPMSALNAQAGAQPMRSGVMPAMPPNGMGQPMMGGASGAVPMSALNAQAGAQPMRSGVMPAMAPNGMGQPMMGGASGTVTMSALNAQAGAQPMRSGVMPAMPPNGMGQPMMGGASGAVPISALNAQAGAQPMRSGMMPAMQQGNIGAQNATPMRSGMNPGNIPQERAGAHRHPDVSQTVSPQAMRVNMERPEAGRRQTRSSGSMPPMVSHRSGNYAVHQQPAGSVMAGMPGDAVMASQGIDVMRNLEQTDSAARLSMRVPSESARERDKNPPLERKADAWASGSQEFYSSGVLRDDSVQESSGLGYAERRPAERRGRSGENSTRDHRSYGDAREYRDERVRREARASYDSQMENRSGRPGTQFDAYEEEEPICVPQPRFSQGAVPQPNAASQSVSSDTRKRVVRETVSAGDDRLENGVAGNVNFGSQPKDVMTGRVRRGGSASSASAEPKNILMTFAQPINRVFGPERVNEMLHFSAGIWNACLLGVEAEEELKNELRDKPNQFKLVQGMIARKHKYFENERWLIDELKVKKDETGHVTINFLVMNLD